MSCHVKIFFAVVSGFAVGHLILGHLLECPPAREQARTRWDHPSTLAMMEFQQTAVESPVASTKGGTEDGGLP